MAYIWGGDGSRPAAPVPAGGGDGMWRVIRFKLAWRTQVYGYRSDSVASLLALQGLALTHLRRAAQ